MFYNKCLWDKLCYEKTQVCRSVSGKADIKHGRLEMKWLKVEGERRKALAEVGGLPVFMACGPRTCPAGPGRQPMHGRSDSGVTCSGNTGKTDKLVAAMKTSNVNNTHSAKYTGMSGVLSCSAGTRGERACPSGPVGVPAMVQGDPMLPLTDPGSVRLSYQLSFNLSVSASRSPQEASGRK